MWHDKKLSDQDDNIVMTSASSAMQGHMQVKNGWVGDTVSNVVVGLVMPTFIFDVLLELLLSHLVVLV